MDNIWELDRLDEAFTIIENIGEGSYGTVTKAYDKVHNEIVALKLLFKIKSLDSIPSTVQRELNILSSLDHPNINKLLNVVWVKSEKHFYLSLEYCESDIFALVHRSDCSPKIIRGFMKQILEGLSYLHSNGIIHRDIKPANIFVKNGNTIKIGDFGLACVYESGRTMTNNVITCSYRPPEILLGETSYGTEVDIWSIGAVFYQMMTRQILFGGSVNENQVISTIFDVCGVPTSETWPNLPNLKYAPMVLRCKQNGHSLVSFLKNKIPQEYHDLIPLLSQCLTLDPSKRATADSILEEGFFKKVDIPEIQFEEIHAKKPVTIPKLFGADIPPIIRPKHLVLSVC